MNHTGRLIMVKFITVDEAATMLRVKRQTLYKWICMKRIPSYSIGGRTLFDEEELRRKVLAGRRDAI
jgi:excisionase family DNA binding protein